MTVVILCNQLERLKTLLKGTAGPLRYLFLVESRECLMIRDYLKQRPGAEEVPKSQLYRQRREAFRSKFVEFMGRLNGANHSNHWWAMTFTTKNPDSTTLYHNTSDFLLIVDLLRSDPRPLLVVTDSADLVAQTKAFVKKERVKGEFLVRPPGMIKRWLKLHTPAGTIMAVFKTFLIWALSQGHRPDQNTAESHVVITTITHLRSFSDSNRYRDIYFGSLVDNLAKTGAKALVLALMTDHPKQQLKHMRSLKSGVPIIPFDACLTFRNLIACALRALGLSLWPTRPKGSFEIEGVDIGCLVRSAVRESRHSGELFYNLRVSYCASWFARRIRIDRCIYPFENRPWEKMLLLGMRSVSSQIHLMGYQHFALTQAHTNFMLGEQECDFTPLPQTILTTGEIATTWLKRQTNIPPAVFQTACALRQGQSASSPSKKRSTGEIRLLVALATGLGEYVGVLSFLEKAFSGASGFQVRIRPHPELFPLKAALAMAPLAGPKYYTESAGPLAEDLEWADMVLYSTSTVGMEGISAGIPAINLDLGDFVNRDPMLGWDEFKWSVDEPSQLIETIRRIEAMTDAEYLDRQRRGKEYATAYLKPVTASALRLFTEVA